MLSRLLHPLFAVLLLCCAGIALDASAATKHSRHHKSSHKKPSGPALVVRGDLATSRSLVNEIAEAYEDAGRGRIDVQPFNTISGIDATLNGSADIAASARPGFPGRAQEAGLTFTPVAWDALVLITSRDNPVSNITLKQLHDVYYGDITNWQQLGGKDEPIDLYSVASPLDGTEYSLRRLLYGHGDAGVAAPRWYINVGALEQGVALDPKALGLSTLSGVHDNKEVKIIPVEGVMPTPATVADGSYPLYTTIYLASSASSPHATDIAKFMDFLNTDEAKKLMRKHDLLPYADATTLTAQTTDQQVAAVTARMVSEGLTPPTAVAETPTPVSAPGATYSHDVSVAPTSERTAQAYLRMTQARAQAQQKADAHKSTPTQPVAATPPAAASTGKPTGDVLASAPATASTASVVAAAASGNAPSNKAEATAPSNPVMISANGTVTPVTPPPASASAGGSYTVSKGDTLSSIARRNSISVSDLRKWNDLKGDNLRIGQVLKLSSAQ
ncbi:MAG TPA: substrate-binding domain-containing protein [Rhodanobacteraceae bacterium]